MSYNPVGWFEIPVLDMERAKSFYEKLLNLSDLKAQDMPEGFEMVWFPMEANAKGSAGALMKGMGYQPASTGTVIYFTCPDIDAALERAQAMGSKIIFPKKDIGQWGWIAWLTDSEGNTVALHTAK